jgi:hypothetical protein
LVLSYSYFSGQVKDAWDKTYALAVSSLVLSAIKMDALTSLISSRTDLIEDTK